MAARRSVSAKRQGRGDARGVAEEVYDAPLSHNSAAGGGPSAAVPRSVSAKRLRQQQRQKQKSWEGGALGAKDPWGTPAAHQGEKREGGAAQGGAQGGQVSRRLWGPAGGALAAHGDGVREPARRGGNSAGVPVSRERSGGGNLGGGGLKGQGQGQGQEEAVRKYWQPLKGTGQGEGGERGGQGRQGGNPPPSGRKDKSPLPQRGVRKGEQEGGSSNAGNNSSSGEKAGVQRSPLKQRGGRKGEQEGGSGGVPGASKGGEGEGSAPGKGGPTGAKGKLEPKNIKVSPRSPLETTWKE